MNTIIIRQHSNNTYSTEVIKPGSAGYNLWTSIEDPLLNTYLTRMINEEGFSVVFMVVDWSFA